MNPLPEGPSELAMANTLVGRECESCLCNLVGNPKAAGMIRPDLDPSSLRVSAAVQAPLIETMAVAVLEDSRDCAFTSSRCSDFSASVSEKDSNTGSGDQDPSLKVRLMCSMGGEILLRPGDGKLRHVGGETRIVSVIRGIRLGGLMTRLTGLYGRAVGSIKYQAAGGGLDALVPVASDADVEAMMEDYQRLSAGGGVSRLRLFLTPPSNLLHTPSMHESGGGGGILQLPPHMKQNGSFKHTVESPIIRNPHLSTTLDNSAENKHEAYKAQINRLSPSSTENLFFGTVSLANNEEGSRLRDPRLSTTLDNSVENKCEPYQTQINRLLPSSTEDPFFGTVSLANNEEESRHGDPPHLSATLDNSVEIKHEPNKASIDRLLPSSAENSFSGTVSLQNKEEGSRHGDHHLSANLVDNSVRNKHEPYETQIDRLSSSSVANPFLGAVSLQANEERGRHEDPHLSTTLDNSIKNKLKPYEAQIDRLSSSSTENPFFGTVSLPDNEAGSRHGDPHLSTTMENSVRNNHKPYEAQIDRLSSSSPGNPLLGSVSLKNNDEGSRHGDCHLSTSLDNSVEIKRLSSSSPENPFVGSISLPNNEEGSRHGSGHGDPHLFTSLKNSVETKQEPYEARIDRLSFSPAVNPFLGAVSLQDNAEGSRNADPHLFTSLENSVESKYEPYKAQIDGLSSSSAGNPFLLATVSLQDEERIKHESRDGSCGHADPHLFTSKENSVENKQEEAYKAWMDGLSSCSAGNPFLGTVCLQDDEDGLRNGRGHWDFLQQKKKPESEENAAAVLSLLSGKDGGDQTYRENWLTSNCMDSMENNHGLTKQVPPLPSLEESYTFPSVNLQIRTSLNEEPMSFSPFNGSSSSLSWGLPDIPLTETAQLISFDHAESTDSALWNSKLSFDELLGLTVNPPDETSLPEPDRFGSGYEKEEKIASDRNSSADFFSVQMEGASGTPYYREGKAIVRMDLNLLPPTEHPLAVADSLKSCKVTGGGGEEEEAGRASLDSMNTSNAILSERNKGEPIFPVFDSLLAGEEQELWLKQQSGVPDSNGRSGRIPTLSIQNWDKMLMPIETQEEIIVNGELSDAASDDFKTDLGSEKDDNSDELLVDGTETMNSVPGDLAARAEEEAIARGLQTIKNIDLEEQRELGSGTFGTVYHGKWRGTDVAIKRLKSSCFMGRASERDRLMADFWREAIILSQLHHPNVVAFYGVVTDGPDGTLATITEYMVNGSLKQVLRRKDRSIDRRKRLLIAMDAAFGMEYLHGKRIVHFDLKCENLLVNMRDTQRPICKVGDLGLSKIKQQTMVSGGVRGTLPWMAPELLNGSSSLVSEKVDVYSFGIVMWELLTGKEPYANMHYGAIIGGIVNNTLRPPIPSSCDPAWRSLMQRSWSADLAERPSFSEIAAELRSMADSLQPRGRAQA